MGLCRALSTAKGGGSVVVVFVKSEEQEGNAAEFNLYYIDLKCQNENSCQV